MLNPTDFTPATTKPPIVKHARTANNLGNEIKGTFLRGPIPMSWLNRASAVSGQGAGLGIGIAIWHLAGMEKSKTIKLRPSVLEKMNISRHARYRGLDALKSAGLISIQQNHGESPIITIIF